MRDPHGYAQLIDPDRPLQEYDTITCAHCGGVVFTKPGSASTVYIAQQILSSGLITWIESPGAACWTCGCQPVCLPCHDLGICRPLESQLQVAEGGRPWR